METMLNVDGADIRLYREGSGSRPIVYLHSGSGEVCSLPFYAQLAQANATVFVPELPGFGGSKPPAQRWRRIEDAVFHLRRVIDLLSPRAPVTLIGSSLGGWLAAELAVWAPDRVNALVLIDAAGLRVEGAPIFNIFGVPGQEADHQAELARRANPHGVDMLKLIEPAFADKGIKPDEARTLHFLRSAAVIAQLGWNPYLHDPRLRSRLHTISTPTLILWGEDDGIIPLEHGRAYASEIPNAQFATIARAGHLPALQNSEATASHTNKFLASLQK